MQENLAALAKLLGINVEELSEAMVKGLESDFGANHYERVDFVVKSASGCFLTDVNDRKVFDCLAAYSAANLGHNNPAITSALKAALDGNFMGVVSNVPYTMWLGIALEKIAEFVPLLSPRCEQMVNKVLMKNGGTEAVESAIKIMRYYGFTKLNVPDGEQEIIVARNNFHGRGISVISFSDHDHYKKGFGPLTPGFKFVDYGDIESLRKAITEKTVGILLEPLQGEGGIHVPPKGYLKAVRGLADKYSLLLTFDEIQTGFYRTGKKFCFMHENVLPDILTIGKALSGGLIPVSAVVTNAELMDMTMTKGSDGSTYGAYPGACFAVMAALKQFEELNLERKVTKMGEHLMNAIKDQIIPHSPFVTEVRGQGLMIGIKVADGQDIGEICKKMLDAGALIIDSHGTVLRLTPPLTMTNEDLQLLLGILKTVLIPKSD